MRAATLARPEIVGAEIANLELGNILGDVRSHKAAPIWIEWMTQKSDRVPIGRQHQRLPVFVVETDRRAWRRGCLEPLHRSNIVSARPRSIVGTSELLSKFEPHCSCRSGRPVWLGGPGNEVG